MRADYKKTLSSFRQLADIRFKPLSLLPPAAGVAVGLISAILVAFKESPLPRLLGGILGLMICLGITVYDVRNSQLYGVLAGRARRIEQALGFPDGGHLGGRPPRALRLFGTLLVSHDRGLAFIYGSVQGAWLFPVGYGILWLVHAEQWLPVPVPIVAGIIAVAGWLLAIWDLQRLDRAGRAPAA